jgi:hypothetical protein
MREAIILFRADAFTQRAECIRKEGKCKRRAAMKFQMPGGKVLEIFFGVRLYVSCFHQEFALEKKA